MRSTDTVIRPEAEAPVVAASDVVVVGGGPAGVSAAVSAARNGASVTLLERYPYLGGAGVRRHGPGARRHAQRHRDLGARPRARDHRAHAREGPVRLPAGGRPPSVGPRHRGGLAQVGALGGDRLLLPHQAASGRLRRRLRSRRLQAGLARHGGGGRRQPAAAQLVPVRHRRGWPRRRRDLRDQGRAPGGARGRGDRRTPPATSMSPPPPGRRSSRAATS